MHVKIYRVPLIIPVETFPASGIDLTDSGQRALGIEIDFDITGCESWVAGPDWPEVSRLGRGRPELGGQGCVKRRCDRQTRLKIRCIAVMCLSDCQHQAQKVSHHYNIVAVGVGPTGSKVRNALAMHWVISYKKSHALAGLLHHRSVYTFFVFSLP